MPAVIDADAGEDVAFGPGDVIFAEGGPSDFVYSLVWGKIELLKAHGDQNVQLAVLGPGEVFGEMGVLDGSDRAATARAIEACLCIKISRTDFLELMQRDATTLMPVMSKLIQRLRDTNEKYVNWRESASSGTDKESLRMGRRVVAEFQPDAIAIEVRRPPALVMYGALSVVGLFIAFGLWSAFAKLEQIIVADGRVVPDAANIIVQPIETSVIRRLHVQQGSIVEAGALLATLDPTFADADEASMRAELSSLDAELTRLRSELDGKAAPGRFSSVDELDALHRRIFDRRSEQFVARQQAFSAQRAALQARIETQATNALGLTEQVALLADVENMYRGLASRGNAPRVKVVETSYQRISAESELANSRARVTELEKELDIVDSQKLLFESNWRAETSSRIAEIIPQHQRLQASLLKQQVRRDFVELRSPVAGMVIEMAHRSVGSVAREAEPLITLVPLDVPLLFEVEVLPRDISRIRDGDLAQIKIESLPFQKHGFFEGRVAFVTEDTVQRSDGQNSPEVYVSRIELTADKTRNAPAEFRLIPGMNITAEILSGERTVLEYLLFPILRGLDEALREPT